MMTYDEVLLHENVRPDTADQGVNERWLSSQAADFFDTGIQNLFPYMTSASLLTVTILRISLSMYVFFLYNTFFSSLLVL
jgi:hypothetical protein